MKWHDDSAAFISMMVTPKTFSLAKSLRSSRILTASTVRRLLWCFHRSPFFQPGQQESDPAIPWFNVSSIFRIHSNHCCHCKKILHMFQRNSILHEALSLLSGLCFCSTCSSPSTINIKTPSGYAESPSPSCWPFPVWGEKTPSG